MTGGSDDVGVLDPVRRLQSLPRDVLVLSVAMFAFSVAFQMTGRYVPEYLRVLGGGAGVIGLYGTVGNLVGALYPYPGGALSDRVGSRVALTAFAVVSTLGFVVWWLAPVAGAPVVLVFLGLLLTRTWSSFGLGATFAVVKQAADPGRLALGFATTETLRRLGFLLGPLLAAAALVGAASFVAGFRTVLLVGAGFAAVGTVTQHVLYDPSDDTIGAPFPGLAGVVRDLRSLPATVRPLLVADTFVRFANGMVYVFFVVTDFLGVGFDGLGVSLTPAAFFGVLLGVEMTVAVLTKVPVSLLAERTGLKPVVGLGFLVYATFPVLLIAAPADQWALVALFAFSGLRFAGLPAHKALVVGPAARDAGGRTTGTYYLARNAVVVPSAALGGVLYGWRPTLAFGAASVVGLVGVALFALFGREFEAYVDG